MAASAGDMQYEAIEAEYQRLVRKVMQYTPRWAEQLRAPTRNVLFHGYCGSGKTSLVRTLKTPFDGRLVSIKDIASGEGHGTREIHQYFIS